MNTEIEKIQLKHDAIYQKFWIDILEPNQSEINNITDFDERKQLQQTQNKIASFINYQSDIIESLIKEIQKRPTQHQLEFYKNLANDAKNYIKILGGNPSNLSYIKNTDYVS
jgi:hypothetical protein